MTNIEILEQTSSPRVLLFLLENKVGNISILKNEIKASQGAIYNALKILEEANLILDEKSKNPPFERIIRITEEGEKIARKLALVFDESNECFPITQEQVEKIKKACEFKEIKAQGIETWQDFVKAAIEEKYTEFESTKLLK